MIPCEKKSESGGYEWRDQEGEREEREEPG